RLERLARYTAGYEHGRPLHEPDRRAPHFRVRDEDERSAGRIDLLAVEGEDRVAPGDEVELLVTAGAGAELVVFLDHPAAVGERRIGVDSEALDPEADAHWENPEPARAGDRRNLVELPPHGAAVRPQRQPLRARAARGG